mmetsp:Transcript_55457/g.154565  ORF Transcript_55457/g.154565 Transcript_55457/m.154565 type:complete len:264 (+) Transcript_55457:244-1035(+)
MKSEWGRSCPKLARLAKDGLGLPYAASQSTQLRCAAAGIGVGAGDGTVGGRQLLLPSVVAAVGGTAPAAAAASAAGGAASAEAAAATAVTAAARHMVAVRGRHRGGASSGGFGSYRGTGEDAHNSVVEDAAVRRRRSCATRSMASTKSLEGRPSLGPTGLECFAAPALLDSSSSVSFCAAPLCRSERANAPASSSLAFPLLQRSPWPNTRDAKAPAGSSAMESASTLALLPRLASCQLCLAAVMSKNASELRRLAVVLASSRS